MSEEDFSQHKQSLIHNLREKPKNLAEETEKHWMSIALRNYRFDRKEKLAQNVEKLALGQWQDFYRDYLLDSKQRHLLLRTSPKDDIHGAGADKKTTNSVRFIQDPQKFKNKQPYFAYP